MVIELQAEWRFSKAKEYTEDTRNLNAGRALEALGAWFRALPDDDPSVVRIIEALEGLYSGPDVHTSKPSVTDILDRFDFNNDPSERTEAEYRAFLEDLCSTIQSHVRGGCHTGPELRDAHGLPWLRKIKRLVGRGETRLEG